MQIKHSGKVAYPIRLLYSVFRIIFLFFMLSTSVILNILQVILSILITPFIPTETLHFLNCLICLYIWTCCSQLFFLFNGIKVSRSGYAKIPSNESAFVISNHVCWADWAFVHDIACRKKMLGSCRYFLKDSVKYLPIFGWGMWLMRMPFLKRNWGRDHQRIKEALSPLTCCALPVWLISFVEGTRFSEPKLKAAQQFAETQSLRPPKLCLLPRCKGFSSTVKALRSSHIKHVYNVTLAYYHKSKGWGHAPSPMDILSGAISDYRVHIDVERIPLSVVPEEPENFLYLLFEEKDSLLQMIKEAITEEL